MIPVKTDLVVDGINQLLHQFRGKPNIEGVLSACLDQIELIDQETFDLVNMFNVDDAVGIILDYVGAIVGVPRDGRNDDDYRAAIQSRLLVNNSEGTPDDLLEILADQTGGDRVRIWEHFPVSVIMYTNGEKVSTEIADVVRQSGPITLETMWLLWDSTGNGFVGAEPVFTRDSLIVEGGDNLVDQNQDQFMAVSSEFVSFEGRSILAEILRPLDDLVTDSGDNIVDGDGNQIVVTSSDLPTMTNDGILMELIESEN
jgi:hypothetical protein